MQLPSDILSVLEKLLHEVEQSSISIPSELHDRAKSFVHDFKPDDSKIFEKGRYTDFEMALFQQALNHDLRKQIRKLKTEIGMIESEVQEWKDKAHKKQVELNKSLNLKSGEREKLLLDANIARLERKVAKQKAENSALNLKLKTKNREIARLLYQCHRNSAA